jgi:TetR/AcrR family transcriptional regulator, transcriptional repressor of bet genes
LLRIRATSHSLGEHGYAGATIEVIAAEAGIAPGLVHHHFESKAELLSCLLEDLLSRFRARLRKYETDSDGLLAYGDAALQLDADADQLAARCWVGVFAEAVRNPALFAQVRRLIDTELASIERRAAGRLSPHDAGSVLAFVIGSLVLGAFAPKKTAGFAAPGLRKLLASLRAKTDERSDVTSRS